MNSGATARTADANFIVESILSGAPPSLSLSSETTLEYAFFGGYSPFANWVGNDPKEWELIPTPESLFLTRDLGEKIRTWVDELDRCQEAEYRGLPAVDDSELVEVALEGLTICELIRDEIPYYYVDPSFLETLPQPVKARVEDRILDWRGRRKIDGKRRAVDRQAMTFQPFGQLPPELPTMSAAIKASLERYSGRAVDPAGDIWRKLDAWHLQYNENFLGLPEKRGQTPRWRPGFDRLGWMAEGLALQQESYTALEGVQLSCGAAYLAISKDEWDSMVAAYLDNRAGGPNETASPAAEGRNEKTS